MQKVLIANRGEIAVRIIRACHDLGLQTVAVYSMADQEALHVLHADEAICIGEAQSNKSYLKIPNILSACEITGADAIHPGVGFLSENTNFASICESCDIKFIGPSPKTIARLGDKSKARATAKKSGCPIVPGSDGPVADLNQAVEAVRKIGFPIFIKAVAGGGGKGIRIAHDESELAKQFTAARTEAEVNFGNPDVYLEKMIVNPRHVEVQIIADKFGNVVHLGERDCTIQRRRQKLIEETPCPSIPAKIRNKICSAAISVVKYAGYYSAGTVEFLVDEENRFYFLEVNTRIQVEHTITEELTGIDLIKQQILIANGEKLPWRQKEISFQGHVIQFRINAEDPAKHFTPSPGHLEYYLPSGGPHVRVDSACYPGYIVPPFYDSMIAKLIVKGKDRSEAILIGKRALREFHIGGVKTTIPFHQYMLEDTNFLESSATISYVDQLIAEGCTFHK